MPEAHAEVSIHTVAVLDKTTWVWLRLTPLHAAHFGRQDNPNKLPFQFREIKPRHVLLSICRFPTENHKPRILKRNL